MTTPFSNKSGLAAALAASLALFTLTTPALGQPTPADIESARALYVQGLELRDRGDLKTSAARFQAAHALAATPITCLELGRAHVLLQQLVEARDVLLSVERLPVRADESPKASNARAEAKALAEQLRDKIPSVVIRFAEPIDGPATRVTVDGSTIPAEALNAPRRLNPGKHTIVASTARAQGTAEITLKEAETQTVTLTLRPTEGPELTPPAPAPDAPRRSEPATEPARPGALFWGGAALGGAGAVVGSVTGILALSKDGALSDVCTGTLCPRSAEDDVSSAKTFATVSTVAFVAAGVGVTLALVAWLTRGSEPPKTARLTPLRWELP